MPKYDISVGDRFYYNNYSTKKGHTLPDYLVITKIEEGFITAKYVNHYIHTNERVLSDAILIDSNLNPLELDPKWVFEKAPYPQFLQSS